jgi:hypothetical protein
MVGSLLGDGAGAVGPGPVDPPGAGAVGLGVGSGSVHAARKSANAATTTTRGARAPTARRFLLVFLNECTAASLPVSSGPSAVDPVQVVGSQDEDGWGR